MTRTWRVVLAVGGFAILLFLIIRKAKAGVTGSGIPATGPQGTTYAPRTSTGQPAPVSNNPWEQLGLNVAGNVTGRIVDGAVSSFGKLFGNQSGIEDPGASFFSVDGGYDDGVSV
jgi:hypothetical protein